MGLKHPKYKVAVIQAAPAFLDLDASVEKTISLIKEAANNGASLVAFPETFIPGYPWHIWLDSPAWSMGKGYTARYFDNSLAYDSPEADRLRAAVKDAGITAVLGLSERYEGSLYIAQWILNPEGETVATRRKLRATFCERTVYGEGDGSDLAVHDIPGLGRVGALCCWEHLQPLSKYAMFAQNEQVHIAAWPSFSTYQPIAYALGGEVNTAAARVYAVEGGCFVLSPCAIVSQEMIDELCDTPNKHELIQGGGGYARIYGPDGRDLVTPLSPEEEGILYADIDLAAIPMAKAAADPVGHYSRPDVTRLLFNPHKAQRVEYVQQIESEGTTLAPVALPNRSEG